MNGPVIPESWVVVPIRELLAPLDGGRLLDHGWSPQCDKEPSRTHDEWGVLKTTSIQPGAFYDVHNKRLPTKLVPRTHLEVRSGDLLLTCAGPRARCGVACLVRETRPRLMLSGKMYRFRAQQELLDSRYLEAFLLANATQSAIDRMKTGISDSGLNLTHERFMSLPVVLAPVGEQHRIVEVIESFFTRLDDAVATLERVQRNLKRYRASVLKAAVEGRLVPTEAELARAEGRSYEPASVLLERLLAERRRRWEEAELAKMKARGKVPKDDRWKAAYVQPVGPNTTGLPELPEGWCWATVDQLERGDKRCAYGVLVPGPDVPTGVPFIRVGDIGEGRIDIRQMKRIERKVADRFAKTYLEGGEVLLTLVGTIGRTAVVPPALAGSNVARAVGVIPASDLIDPHWIECWFRSPMTRAVMIGKAHEVARKTLNLEDVRAAHVALPPRSEQSRIRRALDDYESTSAAVRLAANASVRRCARLRQAILKWAFEGRLVDQDPTDEPASRLLARIRVERESTSEKPARRPRRAKARTAKS